MLWVGDSSSPGTGTSGGFGVTLSWFRHCHPLRRCSHQSPSLGVVGDGVKATAGHRGNGDRLQGMGHGQRGYGDTQGDTHWGGTRMWVSRGVMGTDWEGMGAH